MACYFFNIVNSKVVPNTEVLLLEPFKTIWERDESKNKAVAYKELSYIEFASSYKNTNPYKDYSDAIKREKIAYDVFGDRKWEPDHLIELAINYIENYQEEVSLSYTFFKSAKKAAHNVIEFYNQVDLSERNLKTGNPIYKPKEIIDSLRTAEDTLAALQRLEDKVAQELFGELKSRGNKKVSSMSDPKFINKIRENGSM